MNFKQVSFTHNAKKVISFIERPDLDKQSTIQMAINAAHTKQVHLNVQITKHYNKHDI